MSTNESTKTETNNNEATTTDPVASEPTTNPATVVDAVFDAVLAWIDVGLGHAKTSLMGSARAMVRTAKALEVVRERLRA